MSLNTPHSRPVQGVTLIGFGAIGRSIFQRMAGHASVRITHIVVQAAGLDEARAVVGDAATVTTTVPAEATLVLECAGHAALIEHVVPALQRGVECAVLSIGALSEPSGASQVRCAPVILLFRSVTAAISAGQVSVGLCSSGR